MLFLNKKKRHPTVLLPVVIFLCLFIIYPLFRLFLESLGEGILTWDRSVTVAVLNTLAVSTLTTILTISLSAPLAWLTARTDIPGKKLIEKQVWLTFSVPAYILGIAWIELLGRNGYLFRLLKEGMKYSNWSFPCYSLGAVIVILSIHLYPLVFMSLLPLFRYQDPNREQAAALCGFPPLSRFFRITLPLISPGLTAAGLMVFSRSAANFSIPALLALPIRKEVLTTKIFSALSRLDVGKASFYSFVLMGISALLFMFQQKMLLGKNYTSESRTQREDIVKLGKLRYPLFFLLSLFQFSTGILPVAVLIISSFLKRWGLPLTREFLTLHNYKALFSGETKALMALGNSLTYGIIAVIIAGTAALIVSYYSVYHPSRITGFAEGTAGLPLAVPNIVLAMGAILSWNNSVFPLYGTSWAIILTYAALFLPIMLKNITGLMNSIKKNTIQAARLAGASSFRSLWDILIPLLIPGLEAGVMVCLLIALREIPISLMLYSSGQETLGILLFGMQSQSYGLEMTSTLAVFIIVLTMTGQSLGRKIKKNMRKIYA